MTDILGFVAIDYLHHQLVSHLLWQHFVHKQLNFSDVLWKGQECHILALLAAMSMCVCYVFRGVLVGERECVSECISGYDRRCKRVW